MPAAKFLVVYLRSERQIATTAAPPRGDRIRFCVDLIEGARPGETNAREVSQRLFDRLAELQLEWWKGSEMARNCGGNDVVDLKGPLLREDAGAPPSRDDSSLPPRSGQRMAAPIRPAGRSAFIRTPRAASALW